MPEPLQVHIRGRSYRRNLAVTGVIAIGAAAVAFLPSVSRWERLGAGLVAVTCAALAVGGAWMLADKRPLLVVRDEGVEHRWAGFVPWHDVERLRIFSAGAQPMLGLDLRQAGRYRSRLPWPLRVVAALDALLPRGGALTLPLSLLDLPADELVAEMEARARRPLRSP